MSNHNTCGLVAQSVCEHIEFEHFLVFLFCHKNSFLVGVWICTTSYATITNIAHNIIANIV